LEREAKRLEQNKVEIDMGKRMTVASPDGMEQNINTVREGVAATHDGSITDVQRDACAAALKALGWSAAGFQWDVRQWANHLLYERQLAGFDKRISELRKARDKSHDKFVAAEKAFKEAKTSWETAVAECRNLESAKVNRDIFRRKNLRLFSSYDELADV